MGKDIADIAMDRTDMVWPLQTIQKQNNNATVLQDQGRTDVYWYINTVYFS